MTIFLLTDENLTAAKRALRSSCSDRRSSHLTEALAFGLGFGSHAALRARLAETAGAPAPLVDADSGGFAARLAALDGAAPEPAHFTAATGASTVPDPPFVMFRKADRAANDRHFHSCQRRNRPMLMIKTARRYVELEWDCFTIDADRDGHARDEAGDALVRILFARFQALTKGAPGKPYFYGSAFTGNITKLLPETARQLAEEYFRLLYQPDQESRRAGRRAA